MEATLEGAEVTCILALAKCFKEGRLNWTGNDWEVLGLTESNHVQVLEMMELCGAITNVKHAMDGWFCFFTISAQAVLHARTYEKQQEKNQERKDIVELVRLTLRKHPFPAWSLIIFGALLALVAATKPTTRSHATSYSWEMICGELTPRLHSSQPLSG